jgi:hypothetical protein
MSNGGDYKRYEDSKSRTDAKLKEAQAKTQELLKQTRDNIGKQRVK